jgi:hypothetical protein
MIAKVRTLSLVGERQLSHSPASAIRSPINERDRIRLHSGVGV